MGTPREKRSKKTTKRILCRYGIGCTHVNDPHHRDKFFHPALPQLSKEEMRTHYICNECGNAFLSLSDLQLHLRRKTAWSNKGLVGSRVSVLLDSKEWHEGVVLQYHKSGKHYLEFRTNGEKRWLDMLKVAFYIVERERYDSQGNDLRAAALKEKEKKQLQLEQHVNQNTTLSSSVGKKKANEVKEDYFSDDRQLAGLDEEWDYVEDITQHYSFAQSVLFKIYGGSVQETGHKTRGHVSLTEDDKDIIRSARGSLLYGELLPRGVNKALSSRRLRADTASVLFDLGMGTGKVAIQAFLQYNNLEYVYGVELSQGRYNIAADAALTMVSLLGTDNFDVDHVPGRYITVTEKAQPGDDEDSIRVLHFEQGNLLDVDNISNADVLMLETDVPKEFHDDLCRLLRDMRDGSRVLSYLDLKRLWTLDRFPLRQIDANKSVSDRYSTSWSVQRGHHFYVWQRPHGSNGSRWGANTSSALPASSVMVADVISGQGGSGFSGLMDTAPGGGSVRVVSPVTGNAALPFAPSSVQGGFNINGFVPSNNRPPAAKSLFQKFFGGCLHQFAVFGNSHGTEVHTPKRPRPQPNARWNNRGGSRGPSSTDVTSEEGAVGDDEEEEMRRRRVPRHVDDEDEYDDGEDDGEEEGEDDDSEDEGKVSYVEGNGNSGGARKKLKLKLNDV